jgi:hypothetical protein
MHTRNILTKHFNIYVEVRLELFLKTDDSVKALVITGMHEELVQRHPVSGHIHCNHFVYFAHDHIIAHVLFEHRL